MKRTIALAAVFALAVSAQPLQNAKASQPTVDPSESQSTLADSSKLDASTPECHCADQCDVMWAKATQLIELLSGMRLRIATNFLLETYPATSPGNFTVTVTKSPQGNGAYAIEADFVPMSSLANDPSLIKLAKEGLDLFNSGLNHAGKLQECPAPKS